MIGLDTNILVRFITKDDQSQFEQVNKLLSRFQSEPNSIYINIIVLCELVWVLRAGYKYSKKEIVGVIKKLTECEEFKLQKHSLVIKAVDMYSTGKSDFSDYVISLTNLSEGCHSTYSLDSSPVNEGIFAHCQQL